jgi:hypothetical protein
MSDYDYGLGFDSVLRLDNIIMDKDELAAYYETLKRDHIDLAHRVPRSDIKPLRDTTDVSHPMLMENQQQFRCDDSDSEWLVFSVLGGEVKDIAIPINEKLMFGVMDRFCSNIPWIDTLAINDMPPNSHMDSAFDQEFHSVTFHVPLICSPESYLETESGTITLEAGKLYLINSFKGYGYKNDSSSERLTQLVGRIYLDKIEHLKTASITI